MRRGHPRLYVRLAAFGLVWVAACSDDASPVLTEADPDEGLHSVLASPRAGATLRTPAGRFALTIGAGAVRADTTLTVNVLPPEPGTLSAVYELGPAAHRFASPVTVTVAAGLTPDDGAVAVLASLRDDGAGPRWVPIPGSGAAAALGLADAGERVAATLRATARLAVVARAAAPGRAWVRLAHYAIQPGQPPVDLWVERGPGTRVAIAQNQGVWHASRGAALDDVAPHELATFVVTPSGAGPDGPRLASAATRLEPGVLHTVVTGHDAGGAMLLTLFRDAPDAGAPAVLRVTVTRAGAPRDLDVFDVTRAPPAFDGHLDADQTIDLVAPGGALGLGLAPTGAIAPFECFARTVLDLAPATDGPSAWLFVAPDPERPSQLAGNLDRGDGTVTRVAAIGCSQSR